MPCPAEIRTPRLLLRPPVAADRGAWVTLHRDPRTYTHAPHAMATSDEAAAEQFDKVREHWAERGFGYHVAEIDGAVVGWGGLKVTSAAGEPGEELNLYYRFAPEVQGQGLGREAARAWVAHGFEWLPVLPIIAVASTGNPGSIAIARTAGLHESGRRRLPGDPEEFGEAVVLRAPSVEIVGAHGFDAITREAVLALWSATTDAGGAVGFLPGAPRGDIERALAAHETDMSAGRARAVLLRGAQGALVGLGWWTAPVNPLLGHRRAANRIMTDPARRGCNLGRLLMSAMHRAAREDGAEIGELGVRAGMGTEDFYAAVGWREIGRLPGGIRVGAGDDRDDIWMMRRLDS